MGGKIIMIFSVFVRFSSEVNLVELTKSFIETTNAFRQICIDANFKQMQLSYHTQFG